jgi:hypothetical protein
VPLFVVEVEHTEVGRFVVEAEDGEAAWALARGFDEFALANGPAGNWGDWDDDAHTLLTVRPPDDMDPDEVAYLPVWPRASLLGKR